MPKAFAVPRPLQILLGILLAGIILIVSLLFFALDDSPLLTMHHGFNRDDIQRAKQILYIAPEDRDKVKIITLNQNDINVAASYLLNHFVENTVQIQIGKDRLFAQVAVFVPENPWGRYLDFSFKLIPADDAFKIKSLKIGEISIPDSAANALVPLIVHGTALHKYWQLANHYVKNVRIDAGMVEISYIGSIVDEAKQLVLRKHRAYPHLHLYQQQINDITGRHDPAWRLSLMDLLQPLFLSAYQRADENSAIEENRAIIIAVASYIYKQELRRFLPLGLIYNKEYPVFAYKRIDIPQHFIASALLAAVDASLLGEHLGEDKELSDADHGSGFSFIDLAADRAGTRFGKSLTASPQKARELQRLLSESRDYATIIPDIQDLPEHMDEQTFAHRFSAIGSPAYRDMVVEIDRRIAALPLYRDNL